MANQFLRQQILSFSSLLFLFNSIFSTFHTGFTVENVGLNKTELREKAREMFMHGYGNYMKNAFPHDELMPLSCKGRQRGVSPSRGDVDDSLGNFSLTLVDTLDTLVVLGEFDEFERAARLAVDQIRFDSDFVVSVFETNIRMVGGLISAHLMGLLVKQMEDKPRMVWYSDQLLKMASELANRLLPAFNSTSGVPYSRVNLKSGLSPNLKRQHDTCTACGGTMILEWAALSRLTGNGIYEEKARKAMDFLWNQRHRGSDLMGTVLNVNSGDWVRRDSGIGAGIDSYYEYTLKAYILLGEEDYLYRFNKHYDAVMRYLNKGPVFIDVQMHKPQIASRSFMDALLAFWPGLQVLKGDLRGAIEMHQMLYNVVKKHKFLPDAFTHDLQVHWAQHPLRPEFIESTYFLYRATKDPHYLEVAKEVMDSLEQNVRVPCGFASVKDVRTMEHEDQMESFVLAETFKYLFMIFAEPDELPFHPDNYVLTTEAHFLPLTIGEMADNSEEKLPRRMIIDPDEIIEQKDVPADGSVERRKFASACPNLLPDENEEIEVEEDDSPRAIPFSERTPDRLAFYGNHLREGVNRMLGTIDQFMTGKKDDEFNGVGTCSMPQNDDPNRLRAWNFNPANPEHLEQLHGLGIRVEIQEDGRVQLTHTPENGPSITITSNVGSSLDSILSAFSIPTKTVHSIPILSELQRSKAELLHFTGMAKNMVKAFFGLQFIKEMSKYLNEQTATEMPMLQMDRVVQIVSFPHFGFSHFIAAPAQFGMKFDGPNFGVVGEIGLMDPLRACSAAQNAKELEGRIAVAQRGNCMFEEKAKFAQNAGAIGLIVIDNQPGTSVGTSPLFAMSAAYPTGQNADENVIEEKVKIPAVFLFHKEGQQLLDLIFADPKMVIRLSENVLNPSHCIEQYFFQNPSFQKQQFRISNQFLTIDAQKVTLKLNFYFGKIDENSPPEEKQAVVERNLDWLANSIQFQNTKMKFAFIGHVRVLAYSLLGFPQQLNENNFIELRQLVGELQLKMISPEEEQNLPTLTSLKGNYKRSIICKFSDDPPNQFGCTEFKSTVTLDGQSKLES